MRSGLALLVLAVGSLALPAAAQADVTITPICNGGGCSSGWYRTDVNVSFSVSGSNIKSINCPGAVVNQDTTGQDVSCVVTLTDNTITGKVVTIKRDATPPTTSAITASRGPDANGWYNHAVGVTVTGSDATSGIASCTSTSYSGPDSASASVNGTCTDNAGNVSAPRTLSFSYDATPPGVTPSAARGPDANGWYNHPVAVSFQGTDSVSGIDSCGSASYSGPDSASATVSGTCKDKAGNSATGSFDLHYDATPPSVSGATPDRPPDSNGWYNHKLVVTFAGADATSGVASCDTPSYEKPNAATASVTGRCVDNAGNSSAPGSFAFKYDSTPPTLGKLAASPQDHAVGLTWAASADVAQVKVVRTRSGGPGPVTLYDGRRVTTFTDRKAENGKRYTYVVTVLDVAGNEAAAKAAVVPGAPLIAPRRAAQLQGGATLRWRPVPGATYYNVQLWLRGRKILTTWPAGPSLHLSRLAPGPYRWFVWPGVGPRARHRYGPLIGQSTFVIKG